MVIHLFGDRLKELRKEKKITQPELANMLGVTFSTVSAWEVGKAQPSYDILVKLAQYFGVTTDYLLGLNQEDKSNIEKLKQVLKESGIMIGNDLSISELQRALKIVDILKNQDTELK